MQPSIGAYNIAWVHIHHAARAMLDCEKVSQCVKLLQVHVSLLRALSEDETRAERAEHALDLALLDGVTWPEYLWDFLRIAHDPSGHLSSALLPQPQPQTPPAGVRHTLRSPL